MFVWVNKLIDEFCSNLRKRKPFQFKEIMVKWLKNKRRERIVEFKCCHYFRPLVMQAKFYIS